MKPKKLALMHRLEAMNEDLSDTPDGAWWAILEDTVTFFN